MKLLPTGNCEKNGLREYSWPQSRLHYGPGIVLVFTLAFLLQFNIIIIGISSFENLNVRVPSGLLSFFRQNKTFLCQLVSL